ncbi:hypothetical protein RHSIM_Rhsim10G0002700 [Rhododendron simsii]|uniref:CASP-like protein n=1 Tax=Rhododendron simsii TaxID=118357 RepID=A0A834G929_RHOSS|nr:hypothetical protein RHSIM_Rhsim10G0002700 [Rhododendron simsii]
MATKNSFEFRVKSFTAAAMSSPRQGGGFFKLQIMLRVLAIVFTLAAMVTMLTSDETVNFFGISLQARYSYSSAFKFILVADAIACTCSLLSLIFAFLLSRSEPNPSSYFAVFLHDLVLVLLMMAGCAAASAVGMVGLDGIAQVGWSPICGNVGKFCHKLTLSLAFSFMVILCYLALAVSSAHELKYLAGGTNNQVAEEGVTEEK